MGSLVHEFVGRKKVEGDVGLELECEARGGIPFNDIVGWVMKREGSLRGHGVEFVTQGAIKSADKRAYLARLAGHINDPRIGIVRDSPRTSFHAHLNCHHLTPVQMWTTATAYWLYENVLMEHCGPERIGNLFCLRLKDASGVLNQVYSDLAAKLPFAKLGQDRIRYGGLNLKAVAQFGTLELRGMRGITTFDEMEDWSTQCIKLRDNAVKNFENPEDLMDKFYGSNFYQFSEKVFDPEFFYRALAPKLKDREEIVDEQAGLLSEFAYFHDWNAYQKRIDEELKKRGGKVQIERDIDMDEMDIPPARPGRIRPRMQDIIMNNNVRAVPADNVIPMPQPVEQAAPEQWVPAANNDELMLAVREDRAQFNVELGRWMIRRV